MDKFRENNEWARDSSFDHFWRHYSICDEWRKQHFEAVKQVQAQINCSSQNLKENNSEEDEEAPEIVERLSRCEILEEEEPEEPENVEWKEFQAKTIEHRQKLKEKRDAEMREETGSKPWTKENNEEYVSVEQITVRGRLEQSSEHRDAAAEFQNKREEAKRLYGEAAMRISALESSLEMKFEEEYATDPQMWPNIPFRF